MSQKEHFTLLSFGVGLGLLYFAVREIYLESGIAREPTAITLRELESGTVPENRHLLVTGGPFYFTEKVEYWVTKSPGSERSVDDFYYPAKSSITGQPHVFFRAPATRTDLQAKLLISENVPCIRLFNRDVPGKVFERLAEVYGSRVSDGVILLDADRQLGYGTFMFWALGPLGLVLLTFSALSEWMRPLPFRHAAELGRIHKILQAALWLFVILFGFFGPYLWPAMPRDTRLLTLFFSVFGSFFLFLAISAIETCLFEQRP